jgi:hypothetical protein
LSFLTSFSSIIIIPERNGNLISPSLQNDFTWIQNSKSFTYSVNELEVVFLCGQEVLLVLDGTTGLNMLPQAREFNQVKSAFEIIHS